MTKTARRLRLTKRSIDAAKPEKSRYFIWDTGVRGFGLRVEPTGHKTFVVRYRVGGGRDGKRRQQTLGNFGDITLVQASEKAEKYKVQARDGRDPLQEKRDARQQGITVAQVCDWYLAEASAGRLLGRRMRPIRTTTVAMDRSRITAHVGRLPKTNPLGKRAVAELDVIDLEQFQAAIAAKSEPAARKKKQRGGLVSGGPGVAARTLGMLRAIFAHAKRAGLISINPADGARKLAGEGRTRRLSLDEVRRLGVVLREATGENPDALAAIRFTLLSGCRRNEALRLKAPDIMPAGGVDLKETKSGPQVRPIGEAALALLKSQAVRHGDGDNWLFPAERGEGHFVGMPRALTRICQKAGLRDVTPHVLRHTFASTAGELGFSELVIEGLLGHAGTGSATRGYVHLDQSLVVAATRTAAVLAAALDGAPSGEVVSIGGRRNG